MLDKLMTYIESENYIYALIAIVISLGYNSLKFIDAYHIQRKRRIADLENTIKSKYISHVFKNKLKEEIECEYFRLSYGVRVRKPLIDKAFELHSEINDQISFDHFARALRLTPAIVKKCNTFQLKTTKLEYAFGLYHAFFGIIFIVLGVTMFFNQLYTGPMTLGWKPLFLSGLITISGVYLISMSGPIISLMVINKELKRRHCACLNIS